MANPESILLQLIMNENIFRYSENDLLTNLIKNDHVIFVKQAKICPAAELCMTWQFMLLMQHSLHCLLNTIASEQPS